MYLKSKLLESISAVSHGFGTRDEPIPVEFQELWSLQRPHWKQIHGIGLAEVVTSAQECGEVDALFTSTRFPIAVVTGDCVPILMAHSSGNAVAAIHAGWRGTKAHILSHVWDRLKQEGQKPSDWVAAIGPAIGPCCYEVSEELSNDFLREFGSYAVPQKRILDLPEINAQELKGIGLSKVDIVRFCTRCSTNPYFHSYRRDGGGVRQWSMILKNQSF